MDVAVIGPTQWPLAAASLGRCAQLWATYTSDKDGTAKACMKAYLKHFCRALHGTLVTPDGICLGFSVHSQQELAGVLIDPFEVPWPCHLLFGVGRISNLTRGNGNGIPTGLAKRVLLLCGKISVAVTFGSSRHHFAAFDVDDKLCVN
jgi:hypothetical protein